MRMLMKGVKEISEGNLDFQFQARGRHGEIQYLAEIFNQMTKGIKEMVDSKSRLLLDVSHELRSPLNLNKGGPGNDAQEPAEDFHHAGYRGNGNHVDRNPGN